MPKSYYLPADEPGKGAWLNNLSAKLPNWQTHLKHSEVYQRKPN